ncbi:MAG TPA: hypothetical protein PLH19_11315 [Anaerolineae bacterium]|nr:hypothetical protein [Anaerolineae bacterium]HQH39109.1 hypothetical protein [Anaerolineae bacterium]
MTEEKSVEEVVVEETPVVEEGECEEKHEAKKPAAATLKDALKQVETFGQALSDALQARGNVVMVRVNDEALAHLDMLVDAEVTKSRSESAAFLIAEGIKANRDLFEKIGSVTQQISELREQLRQEVKLAPKA